MDHPLGYERSTGDLEMNLLFWFEPIECLATMPVTDEEENEKMNV